MTIEEIKVSHLTRGTIYITNTSAGDIMLGLPPEILKETLDFSKGFPPAGIPLTCVIPDDLWNTESFQLNVECEFPFYGNKFLMGRKMNIVCEPSQEKQIFENQWLSLTGNRDVDLRSLYDDPLIVPSIRKESEFFTKVQKSEVANYILFNEKKEAIIQSDSGKVKITKLKKNTFSIFDETFNKEIGQFEIFEESHSRVVPDLSKKVISKKKYFGISSVNRFEVVEIIKKYKEKMLTLFYSLEETELVFREGLLESNFDFIEDESDRLKLYSFYENLDLRQKVIFISTQSGFDPLDKETNPEHRYGSTVSFCIIDEFSFITVVDPPFNCVQWLADNGIPLMMVKNVIITHNHADHDAGFSEFILRIGRKINL
ncbi:MAG: hypothetical protein KDK36_12510, partial [Leptospiraceae bacterium]|nr:hypothetical protein [Leptospiraceae bacterium]